MALWQRGQVKLVWSEGHELHGLEVVMRRVPLGDTIEGWLSEPEVRPDWDDLTPKQRAERTQENAEQIGRLIVGWNYADEHGDAVPATPEALLACCDGLMINEMRDAYLTATTRVAPPLPQPSAAGPPPGEWDLPPQETLATPAA